MNKDIFKLFFGQLTDYLSKGGYVFYLSSEPLYKKEMVYGYNKIQFFVSAKSEFKIDFHFSIGIKEIDEVISKYRDVKSYFENKSAFNKNVNSIVVTAEWLHREEAFDANYFSIDSINEVSLLLQRVISVIEEKGNKFFKDYSTLENLFRYYSDNSNPFVAYMNLHHKALYHVMLAKKVGSDNLETLIKSYKSQYVNSTSKVIQEGKYLECFEDFVKNEIE